MLEVFYHALSFLKRRFLPGPDLDAVLELVARVLRAFPQQLTEDDDLFKKENPPLFTPGQHPSVLLPNTEGLLLQQLPMGRQLPLRMQQDMDKRGETNV